MLLFTRRRHVAYDYAIAADVDFRARCLRHRRYFARLFATLICAALLMPI